MKCCLEPFLQHCIGFWPEQCCFESIKKILHRTFSYSKLSGASRAALYNRVFDLCNVVPRVLRQNCTGFLLLGCCLELLRKHCVGFLPDHCCPNSIKATGLQKAASQILNLKVVIYVGNSKRVWDTSVLYTGLLAGSCSLQRSWKTVKIMEHCQHP